MQHAMLAVALAAALGSTVVSAAPAKPSVSGHYLVVFKSATLPADAATRITNAGGVVHRSFGQIGVVTASGNAAFASTIAKDSKVQAVGPEHLFKMPDTLAFAASDADIAVTDSGPTAADVYYGYQWDMRRIGADQVWARLPVSPVVPRVAVLDVGTMDTHPDLVGQINASKSTSYCNTSGGANNTDGYPIYSTYIDLFVYPDWTPGVDPCTPLGFDDYEFHGTHTAGTVAAKFGGGKVVGVAPDAKVGVYKVFDAYSVDDINLGIGAFDGPLFSAIIDATINGYPVISMSLGGNGVRNDKNDNASWQAWNRVSSWATRNGTLLVAAAGNSSFNLNGTLYNTPSDIPSIVAVSATGSDSLIVDAFGLEVEPGTDALSFYSNYGSSVDIAAPGGCGADPTCAPNFPFGLVLSDGIDEFGAPVYYFAGGTSMATPHVAAVAAYVRAIHPDWTPGAVRWWLKETAQSIGPRQYFGAGMVDANAAAQ